MKNTSLFNLINMDFIANSIFPLVLPLISSVAMVYAIQVMVPANSAEQRPREAQVRGMISINVFKGAVRENYEIDASSTPDQLKSVVFNRDQLNGKNVVFVCNGRKLQQNVSIGMQGVRSNSYLYTQITDALPLQELEMNSHSLVTFVLCGSGILGLWMFYFCYPGYFSFVSRFLLIVFTELLIGFKFIY